MKTKILNDFGTFLKKTRVEKLMTQAELARLCDLHTNYIIGIEKGRRNPSLIVLIILQKVLEFKWEDFFMHVMK